MIAKVHSPELFTQLYMFLLDFESSHRKGETKEYVEALYRLENEANNETDYSPLNLKYDMSLKPLNPYTVLKLLNSIDEQCQVEFTSQIVEKYESIIQYIFSIDEDYKYHSKYLETTV